MQNDKSEKNKNHAHTDTKPG